MTHQDFTYWLQGYFELNPDSNTLTEAQVAIIKEHLQLVFTKVTTGTGDLGFQINHFPSQIGGPHLLTCE